MNYVDDLRPEAIEHLDRIDFMDLREGDLIILKTSPIIRDPFSYQAQVKIDDSSEKAWLYELSIRDRGAKPLAYMTCTTPDGDQNEGMVRLIGCGRITTEKENPVQRGDPLWGRPTQHQAFNLADECIYVGGKMVFSAESSSKWAELNDYCTEISVIRASHVAEFATAEDIRMAEHEFIERMVAEGKIKFSPNGLYAFTSDDFKDIEYRAFLEGFGFPKGFIPQCHNWIWDDVGEDEGLRADNILKSIDRDRSKRYWFHRVDRTGLDKLIHFWYKHGHDCRLEGFGFPWWGEQTTATQYVAMSPAERTEYEKHLLNTA